MLQRPRKLICPGQAVRYPLSPHDPRDWLRPVQQETNTAWQKLVVFDLDGYIVDAQKKVTAVFQKLEYTGTDFGQYAFDLSHLHGIYDEKTLQAMLRFSEVFEADFCLFIWPALMLARVDDAAVLDEKNILFLRLKRVEGKVIVVQNQRISPRGLESVIFSYRKRDFSNPKPLKSGTSTVGCFLSNATRNPWPGDLDFLFFNPKTGNFGLLLEFKTHNMDTPVADEHIGKYNNQDWRRFEVLFALQRQLAAKSGHEPTLVYLAWGTQDLPNHQQLKIQVLQNGAVSQSLVLPRPEFGVFSPELFQTLLDLSR